MGICDKVGFERRIPIPFAYSQKVFSFRGWHANNIKQEEVFCVYELCMCCCISFTKISPFSPKKQAWRKPSKNSCTNSPRFYLLGKQVTTSHQKLVKTHKKYIVQLYTTTIVQKHPPTKRRPFFILFTLYCRL